MSRHLDDAHATLEAMIKTKPSSMPGHIQVQPDLHKCHLSVIHIQATYVQNMAKLYSRLVHMAEQEDDWDVVLSLDNMLDSKLPLFAQTDHLEAQERVSII